MSTYKNEDILSIEYTRDVFKIKWRLTGWCNYHCPYCINGTNKEPNDSWNTNETLINRAIKLNEMLKKNNIKKPIHLSLLGGEVIFLDIKNIISKIDNISNLNITTNFSKPIDYFEDLFIWCRNNDIKLFLHCSYHPEAIDFKEKLLKLTYWCQSHNFSTPRGSVVIKPEDDAEKILKEYYDFGLTKMVAQRMKLISDDSLADLTDDNQFAIDKFNINYEKIKTNIKKDYKVTFKDGSIAEFKTMSNFLSKLDHNGFVPNGYLCYSGINCIVINWDGQIYRSNCYELNWKQSLGNIDYDDIVLPSNPYVCNNTEIRCCLKNGVSVYKIKE